MSFTIFCKREDAEPSCPEGGAKSQCLNCADNILEGKIDESMGFKWKALLGYPEDRSCPDCGEEEIHVDPREVERHCQFSDESHGMYCCRCGTWMYKPANTDMSGWECPCDSCSVQRFRY